MLFGSRYDRFMLVLLCAHLTAVVCFVRIVAAASRPIGHAIELGLAFVVGTAISLAVSVFLRD